MTKLSKFSIWALLCLMSISVFAQFSRNDATNLVLNTILTDDIGKVDVYSSYNSITGNVERIDNQTVDCPYTGNWIFFVDDKPFSGWFHSCRYIFVNDQNGDYTVVDANIFPKNQGTDYELVSEAQRNQPFDPGDGSGSSNESIEPNDHSFAVIISDGDYQQYWNDASLIYNTLIDVYGYKKENIFVHYGPYGTSNLPFGDDLDGGLPSDDIDYSAFGSEVHATFNELAGITNDKPEIPALGHSDQLAVFFVDVATIYGGPDLTLWAFWNDNGGGPYLDVEDPGDIAQIVNQIDCAQMTLTFSFNYADAVMDVFSDYSNPVVCKNRYLHCCSDEEEKHLEMYITGGSYGEYFYYWASAARGVYPGDQPWIPSDIEVGDFPFTTISGLEDHPDDYNPDLNEDGYVQMEEAFSYADNQDTWSDDGYYFNPYTPGEEEDPQQEIKLLFQEPVMTLWGLAGELILNQTVTGNYIIGKNLTIKNTGVLNIGLSSEFYFTDGNSRIYVDGELHIGENVLLKGQDDAFLSLLRMNTGGILTVGNGTEFNNMRLEFTGYPIMENLSLNQVKFNTFDINGHIENTTISNTEFNGGWLQLNCNTINISSSNFNYGYAILEAISSSDNLTIDNCTFTNSNSTSDAVQIESFPNYTFSNNSIDGYNNGLYLFNCGTGKEAYNVNNNYIHNCTGSAIATYATKAKISNNFIIANGIGVKLMNKSSIELRGNKDAGLCAETQSITNNSSYEVYSTEYSFPYYFKYNCIKDPDNAGGASDALVYYKQGIIGNILDVRFNCWGENFDPSEDLYPPSIYIYDPEWCPDGSGTDSDNAAEMYSTAQSQIEQENYNDAKATYISLIEQYPDSKYAKTALKDLVELEKFVNNDYSSLKAYYETEPAIQNNPKLVKLADFLANRCNIKLANWPDAISWFENVIQNPESVEDSIFAIIDLSYTYWLMENGGMKASSYVGSMPQYKFTDYATFEDNRDYLLSLLPGDDSNLSESMKQKVNALQNGELLQNIPNPFTGRTDIYYRLDNDAVVTVNVFDYTGKQIKTYTEGEKSSGVHSVVFDAKGMTPGMYFYSIDVNGIRSDTKKMIVK